MKTNAEFYAEEIRNVISNGSFGFVNGKAEKCMEIACGKCLFCKENDCKGASINWLISEYKPVILDDSEKNYLKEVIKPFRDSVEYITKYISISGKEYIYITFKDGDIMNFPRFESKKMYVGMEMARKYKLEELGL